eukprot:scaffold186971_cov18-Tisochrysis_lutea.AAC.1
MKRLEEELLEGDVGTCYSWTAPRQTLGPMTTRQSEFQLDNMGVSDAVRAINSREQPDAWMVINLYNLIQLQKANGGFSVPIQQLEAWESTVELTLRCLENGEGINSSLAEAFYEVRFSVLAATCQRGEEQVSNGPVDSHTCSYSSSNSSSYDSNSDISSSLSNCSLEAGEEVPTLGATSNEGNRRKHALMEEDDLEERVKRVGQPTEDTYARVDNLAPQRMTFDRGKKRFHGGSPPANLLPAHEAMDYEEDKASVGSAWGATWSYDGCMYLFNVSKIGCEWSYEQERLQPQDGRIIPKPSYLEHGVELHMPVGIFGAVRGQTTSVEIEDAI